MISQSATAVISGFILSSQTSCQRAESVLEGRDSMDKTLKPPFSGISMRAGPSCGRNWGGQLLAWPQWWTRRYLEEVPLLYSLRPPQKRVHMGSFWCHGLEWGDFPEAVQAIDFPALPPSLAKASFFGHQQWDSPNVSSIVGDNEILVQLHHVASSCLAEPCSSYSVTPSNRLSPALARVLFHS